MEPQPQTPEAHSSLASDLVLRALERQAVYLARQLARPYAPGAPSAVVAHAANTHFERYVFRIPPENPEEAPTIYQFNNTRVLAAYPELPTHRIPRGRKLIEVINALQALQPVALSENVDK